MVSKTVRRQSVKVANVMDRMVCIVLRANACQIIYGLINMSTLGIVLI
jgi:hypothetical protein